MSRSMVSRPIPMPTPLHWDIFCNVIDNFGDIGVCWRLARQLAHEHGFAVRLWVDDLTAFRSLCPEIRADRDTQVVQSIEVRHWVGDLAGIMPGDVVVEAFACRLPERFEAAMATRSPKPVWINLDYLSAEAWVAGCHALPSPHPRLPLTKYFFFPGFAGNTGGLLREADLENRRQEFLAAPDTRRAFLATLGVPQPAADSLLVSLFSYENPALDDLLDIWTAGRARLCCLAPLTRNREALERFAGRQLRAGDVVRRGQLELHAIPFVPQPDYDKLLWACDVNFVRGEDSFVRAQWSARPMVWQIYPQQEKAHHAKLVAFLDVYCAGLAPEPAETVRALFLAWNGERSLTGPLWEQWRSILPDLRRHAAKWQKKLIKQQDLCARLVQFCRTKL